MMRGVYFRLFCLIALIIYKIYFIIHGFSSIRNQTGEMGGIFICNNPYEVTECSGLDDYATCGDIECIASSCGRPLFPGIGISYAGTSDPYDAYAGKSTQSFITIMAIFYSLIPYLLQMYFGIHFLAWGNIVSLTRLGIMLFLSVANDAILKNVLKQPRPIGSCLYFHSYGMPSGHASTSIGLLTFVILELLMYHPNLLGTKEADRVGSSTEDVQEDEDDITFTWGYGWKERSEILSASLNQSMLNDDEGSTITGPDALTSTDRIQTPSRKYFQMKWLHHYYALIWTVILLPIPFSRPYLHDHTPMQVIVGSFVGAVLGCIWYFCFIRGWIFGARDNRNSGLLKKLVNSRIGKSFGLNVGVDRWRFPEVQCDPFLPMDSVIDRSTEPYVINN